MPLREGVHAEDVEAPQEASDLAAIERVDAPEARLRALGEARAAAGDPWGAWVLSQLAGKVTPSEAELRAVVDLLNVSHPHRFGDLWELIEEAGLPPCFRSLIAGNPGAEHFLPLRLPAMEELTLIASHFELPGGTDLGSLRRLTLDGAVRFENFRRARWPSPESLTLRAPEDLDDDAEESVVRSMRQLLAADFVAALPRLRLEQWGADGARQLAKAFGSSALRRMELWRCAPELEAAMRSSLGGRVTVVPDS